VIASNSPILSIIRLPDFKILPVTNRLRAVFLIMKVEHKLEITIPAMESDAASSQDDFPLEVEALMNRHWTGVYGIVLRLTGDPQEAEDLALEVFWRLYRQPPVDRTRLAGWLYRVASNLGLNALRARKRRAHYETESIVDSALSDPPADPAEQVERRIERQQVRDVLAQLKPRDAQLLVLRHAGLTYAEVADALGLATSSIGTLLTRAEADFERRYCRLERRS
jgi:RNA polymerase sigma-70 factor, ECF subfamily